MSLVNMNDDSVNNTNDKNKLKLTRGFGWWDFDTDSKGNKVYRENGLDNQRRMDALKAIRAYFDDSEPDTLKDRYDLSG